MSSKIEIDRTLLSHAVTLLSSVHSDVAHQLTALLAAPVVERQDGSALMKIAADLANRHPLRQLYLVCEHQGRINTDSLHEHLDKCGDLLAGIALDIRRAITAPPELAELQATIARLETKVNNAINLDFERRAEIERLKGEPVEWRYRFTHRGELSKWFPVDSYMKLYTIANDPAYEVQPLYTSQPAPVSVVSDETINNAKRYELLRSGPINDDDGGCLWVWDWRGENYEECGNSLSGEALDAAVDACLDKVKGLNQ